MVSSIVVTAVPSATPGGRLNEIVLATKTPWWLTTSEVWLCPYRATLASGIIASWLVLTAVPVDDTPLPVPPIELVARFRTAFDAIELMDGVFDDTAVPATALVVCEPLAGPPEVLT